MDSVDFANQRYIPDHTAITCTPCYRHILRPKKVFLYDKSISGPGKVNAKVKFTLEQAMKAQRGSKGTALLFL